MIIILQQPHEKSDLSSSSSSSSSINHKKNIDCCCRNPQTKSFIVVLSLVSVTIQFFNSIVSVINIKHDIAFESVTVPIWGTERTSSRELQHQHQHQQQRTTSINHDQSTSYFSPTTATTSTTTDYAYAFLLAGIDLDTPSYRGFLWNIMVAAKILRDAGSTMDIVIMISMAPNNYNGDGATALPKEEEYYLSFLNCTIKYLPPVDQRLTFHDTQMMKFHILNWTEYKRVLYMDSDVIPLTNLDYIFFMSDQHHVLQSNMVVAWTEEPANGGFFMLKPGIGEYEELTLIVQTQKRKFLKNQKQRYKTTDFDLIPPIDRFDEVIGWGHRFGANTNKSSTDLWYSFNKKKAGKKWNFYAAYSDQGLLYHWVKYVKKDVSIVISGKEIDQVSSNSTRRTNTIDNTKELFRKYSPLNPAGQAESKIKWTSHPAYKTSLKGGFPYNNYIHFYAGFKPWKRGRRGKLMYSTAPDFIGYEKRYKASSAIHFWFEILRELDKELEMGIDFVDWEGTVNSFQNTSLATKARAASQITITTEKGEAETTA